jgi:redox-sensing transcriptional repressor
LVSSRTIGRLSLYRRLLTSTPASQERHIYSHQLAAMAGGTAVQVRRDLMVIGCTGSTTRGYDRAELIESIGRFLDDPQGACAALVGVGNLGRAILAYFAGRRPKLAITAAFDNDPSKTDRVIRGCRCYLTSDLVRVAAEQDIQVGIIAVPAPAAQEVADLLVQAGVTGILNFAPTGLRLPGHVYLEEIDMTTALEKTAYFGRQARLTK